jgi:hypothetical protein
VKSGTIRSDSLSKGNGENITVAMLAKAKRLPVPFLKELGLRDVASGVEIPYYGPTGEEIAAKRRAALKAADGSYWPRGLPLAAYGQWRLDAANKVGFLLLVEGESDCWTLWHHGLPALGLPGSGTAKTLLREHVEGVEKIYVHHEPDRGGEMFVAGVRGRLAELGFKGKVYQLQMSDGIKDPADLHTAAPDDFKVKLERAIRTATPIELSSTTPTGGTDRTPSTKAKPAASVRQIPPYQPFPVAALPTAIRDYVVQGALALGCDPSYLALPALAVAASLIGNTRVIRLKRKWVEPSVIWAAIVGDSGTLKSPAYLLAVNYLFRMQKRLRQAFLKELAEYKRELEEYQERKKQAKKDGNDAAGAPPHKSP